MALYGLFPDQTVAPVFKKRARGDGSVHQNAGGINSLFQGVADSRGDALFLIVFVDIEPVKVAVRNNIAKNR